IVVDAGRAGDNAQIVPASDADMLREFGEMTARSRLPRRRALNALARKHRRPPNEVYAAIERAKKLVESPLSLEPPAVDRERGLTARSPSATSTASLRRETRAPRPGRAPASCTRSPRRRPRPTRRSLR